MTHLPQVAVAVDVLTDQHSCGHTLIKLRKAGCLATGTGAEEIFPSAVSGSQPMMLMSLLGMEDKQLYGHRRLVQQPLKSVAKRCIWLKRLQVILSSRDLVHSGTICHRPTTRQVTFFVMHCDSNHCR